MSKTTAPGATDRTVLQIQVRNLGGDHCRRALETVKRHCDLPAIASWRATNGNEGGNCFFATTHAAIDLVRAGMTRDCLLVTGRFDHPDVDGPVYHAWLEFRHVSPWAVVNVSRLQDKPLYTIPRRQFYEINHCRKRIQEVPLTRLRVKAAQMSRRNQEHDGHPGIDIRALTHRVLGPTLSLLPPLQTDPPLPDSDS